MDIEITDVKIFKIKQRGALLGYANIVLNNCFIIRGIKILETQKNGKFVGMPSRPLRDKKRIYRDLCHPINKDTRELITIAILDAYNSQDNIKED